MEDSLSLLALFVFVAGFVDAIAGGGGLITIPAYLNYGVSETMLLGTNKLSSTMGTTAAVLKYLEEIKFNRKLIIVVFISSILFSAAGAYFISMVSPYIIRVIVIFLLPIISLYMIKKKEFAIKDVSDRLSEFQIVIRIFVISSLISFYDGIMGPGTGTFLAVSYSAFVGFDILKSTALAKFTNLLSNLSALITFMILKRVDIKLGLIMGCISVAGNYTGAKLTLKKGSQIIRPLIVIVANLMLLKIIIDTFKSL